MSEAGTTPLRAGRIVVVGPGGWHAYWPDLALYLVVIRVGTGLLRSTLGWLGSLGGIGYLFDTSCPPTLPGVIVADLDQAVTDAISSTISLLAAQPPATTTVAALDCLARLLDVLRELGGPVSSAGRGARGSILPGNDKLEPMISWQGIRLLGQKTVSTRLAHPEEL